MGMGYTSHCLIPREKTSVKPLRQVVPVIPVNSVCVRDFSLNNVAVLLRLVSNPWSEGVLISASKVSGNKIPSLAGESSATGNRIVLSVLLQNSFISIDAQG